MKRFALLFLVACGSSTSSSPAPATPPPSNTDPTPPPAEGQTAPAVAPALGQPCGEGDTCGDGATCVSYYGIAGPRGPQFKSCEIKCKADDGCPASHRCTTVADGPGQVCRPIE